MVNFFIFSIYIELTMNRKILIMKIYQTGGLYMKKLLSTLVVFTVLFCATMAEAKCPCEGKMMPPKKGCEKMMPCKKACNKKMMECKKAEMAKKLCLTAEQQEEMDKIHEKKMNKMKKLHNKIQKYEEKICEARQEKMEAKKEAMEAFKEVLTDEQKCKFEKMMQEHRAEMKKIMSPCKDCDCECPQKPCEDCKCPECPCKKQMPKCPCYDKKPCDKPCDCNPCDCKKPCDCQKPCDCAKSKEFNHNKIR